MKDHLEEEEQTCSSQKISIEFFKKPITDLCPQRAICLNIDATVSEAIEQMQYNKVGSILITNAGVLVGIFTERDVLMKLVEKVDNWETTKVTEFMTSSPACLRMNDAIAYALHNIHFFGFTHIPIVDSNQRPIAIISIKDINNYLMDLFPNEIHNIKDEFFRGQSKRKAA